MKGVGPRKFQLLNRLGIKTVEDLLYYFPRRYEDRRQFSHISKIKPGKVETIKGEILSVRSRRTKRRLSVVQITVADDTEKVNAIWFNQPYLSKKFKAGDKIILHGKVEKFFEYQMNSPEYEIISSKGNSYLHIGRIVPIYSLTAQLSQRSLRTIIREAVSSYAHHIKDILPFDIVSRNRLLHLTLAIKNIHFPENDLSLRRARERLVFDEFFFIQLLLGLKRARRKKRGQGIVHRIKGDLFTLFEKIIPFKLTSAQIKIMKEIARDMASSQPMNRLLQGEVGSGKTILAAFALIVAIESGSQAALMVPTETLAVQHYFSLSRLFISLGVKTELLVGSMKNETKMKIKKELKEGRIDIIIGTHALIQEGVEFKKLGLVIVDEQHKFGVTQRNLLGDKGVSPDFLVMSATPIPRTLALTLYGDLNISTLRELPPGRKPVTTYWVSGEKRKKVYDFVAEEINKGRQAYIVYPLIKKSSQLEVAAAEEMYQKLKEEVFPQFRVGLLHGRMEAREKFGIMDDFRQRKIDILVSTVVIEVGVDVSNASIIVIEHAERFGLSQLHQLRGRIGRSSYASYCILISNPKTKTAQARLKTMLSVQNGFEIAEADLTQRGPGELFGFRQHGFLPQLKIANLVTDIKLLECARREAFNLVACDPYLKASHHSLLRERAERTFLTIA